MRRTCGTAVINCYGIVTRFIAQKDSKDDPIKSNHSSLASGLFIEQPHNSHCGVSTGRNSGADGSVGLMKGFSSFVVTPLLMGVFVIPGITDDHAGILWFRLLPGFRGGSRAADRTSRPSDLTRH